MTNNELITTESETMNRRFNPTLGGHLLLRGIYRICLGCIVMLSLQGFSGSKASVPLVTKHKDWRRTPKFYVPSGKDKLSGTGKDIADAFIKANRELFKVNPNDLQLSSTRTSLLGTHYRYTQFINGIPVDGGELVVSIDKNGSGVYQSYNGTFPYDNPPALPASSVTKTMALDTAWKQLRVHGNLKKLPAANLFYLPKGKNAFQLVFKTETIVTAPRGQWEHTIDAVSGKILSVKDKIIYKNPVDVPKFSDYQGPTLSRESAEKVFVENQALAKAPIQFAPATGTALVFDGDPKTFLANDLLSDASPASAFAGAYVSRPLTDISLNAGTYSLVGPWVRIVDFEAPTDAPSTSLSGNWTATRGDNAFNDVMSYFHIDQNQRYLQSLGYTGASGIQEGSIQVDSNGASGADNSYYLPGTNQLSFGHGGVDDNEDADVILHEYGHAITHDIIPTWSGGDTAAIGEGFGDYWGGSYSSTTTNGTTYHPEWAFSWDGHNSYWSGRDMDRTDLIYDENITYTDHQTISGIVNYSDQLWSTPLFQAFLTLRAGGTPREEIDTVVIESFFGVGSSPTMRDLALATVNAASLLYPAGPHAAVFTDKFLAQKIIVDPDDPADVAATLAASDQVDVSWTLNVASDPVVIAYNTTNVFGTPTGTLNPGDAIPGGGTVIYKGAATSYSHSGLAPGTTYFYKAWSVLAGPSYSPGIESRANTPYLPPFTEDFETGSLSRWGQIQESGFNSWSIINGGINSVPANAHTGSNNAIFANGDYSAPQTKLVVTLDFGSAISGAELTFWHHMEAWAGDQDELRVYYRNSLGGPWVLLAAYTSSINTWTQQTLSLPNLSSMYSIAFEGTAGYGYGVCIDDVSIDLVGGPAITVSGNARAIANNDTTPSMADGSNFGTVFIGAPVAQSFTITNSGLNTLTLTGSPDIVSISGDPDFSISNQPLVTSIAPGNSTTFDVLFSPSISGAQSATISIANNTSGANPFIFDVSGNGPDALELVIDTTTMSEYGGTANATVYRTSDTATSLMVTLSSSDVSEATVPLSIVIPAGQEGVAFTVTAVDDAIIDWTQSATIIATATGHLYDTKTLTITDNDSVGGGGGGSAGGCTLGRAGTPSLLLSLSMLILSLGIRRILKKHLHLSS